MDEEYEDTIAKLKCEIRERDDDIQKAATFGNQLLEDKVKLTEKLHEILSENETLIQDKYSLQLDLEAKIQTVNSQSSEYEFLNQQFDNVKRKLELQQRENNSQKQQINRLTHENEDLEKNIQEAVHGGCQLQKTIAFQEQKIQGLQQKAEMSLNISLPQNIDEENDVNYYKLQNKQLQEALAEVQFELKSSQMEESRLINMIKELEEAVKDRDGEIKACSMEIKRSSEMQAELQGEIEMLKLEQLDVNRRGNSVFGELDDRRLLVEKEYKLLVNKYKNMLINYENNKNELSNCKGQMAILLSMTSRNYQLNYIKKLEENLMDSKRENDSLNVKLVKLVRSQNQQQLNLDHMRKGGDQYAYLKVMFEQAEMKNKTLDNELVTLRLQNRADKDQLTATQQRLYQTETDLDSIKIENMKLMHELRDLTVKPDAPTPVEKMPRIEILPGYNLSPATVKKLKAEICHKSTPSDDMVPGELLLVDGEFREVKKPSRSNKAILRSFNRVEREEVQERVEFSPEVKYLKDNTDESQENDPRPSYVRYRSAGAKSRNDDNCKQQ